MFDAALAAEDDFTLEPSIRTWPSRMVVKPYGWFARGVFVVAHADERLLEELHDGGEHFFARQARRRRFACCAAESAAARGRRRASGCISFHRALRASGVIPVLLAVVCVRPVTCRWPRGSGKSRRCATRAGSPGAECARASRDLSLGVRRAERRRRPCRASPGGFPGGCRCCSAAPHFSLTRPDLSPSYDERSIVRHHLVPGVLQDPRLRSAHDGIPVLVQRGAEDQLHDQS